jgi:hypothetical protein
MGPNQSMYMRSFTPVDSHARRREKLPQSHHNPSTWIIPLFVISGNNLSTRSCILSPTSPVMHMTRVSNVIYSRWSYKPSTLVYTAFKFQGLFARRADFPTSPLLCDYTARRQQTVDPSWKKSGQTKGSRDWRELTNFSLEIIQSTSLALSGLFFGVTLADVPILRNATGAPLHFRVPPFPTAIVC